jgi:dephospho-CoA kinase
MNEEALPEVLAVVGLAGSGKSEATGIVASEHGYEVVYFGGVVVQEVERRGLEVNPANEKVVREDLRASEGMDAIARRSLPAIQAILERGGRVGVDGVYSAGELDVLRSELTVPVVTLAVHAPRYLRKERLARRAVRPLTAAEVDARDQLEVANLDKAPPIALADLHVVNDSTLDELSGRVEGALRGWAVNEGASGSTRTRTE